MRTVSIPTVLTALLLAAFVCAALGRWYRVAGLIALAYAGTCFAASLPIICGTTCSTSRWS
jgi:hypothetical protein